MRVFPMQQCLGRKSLKFQELIENNIEQDSLNLKKF